MNTEYFINNPSAFSTAFSFAPIPAQKLTKEKFGGKEINSGTRVKDDGSIEFCLYAPSAETVIVKIDKLGSKLYQAKMNYAIEPLCKRDYPVEYTLELSKGDDGCYRGVMEWTPLLSGYCKYTYVVDGLAIVDPYSPVTGGNMGCKNFIEVPDKEMEDILVKDVPHGAVTIDIYWSSVMNKWIRQLVYTPPGYRQSKESYPVVYLHQGLGGSETEWVYDGKVPQIMDNLIADGKAVKAIIVMNDGMHRTNDEDPKRYDGFLRMIKQDTIPFVESNYRCKADKWNRALAGLSMGGMQACKGGLENPDLFAWLGLISSAIRMRDTDLDFEDNEFLNILADRKKTENEYKLIYRINGIGELNRDPVVLGDEDWIKEHGVDKYSCYKREILRENGGEHDWTTFRHGFRDFMTEVFK